MNIIIGNSIATIASVLMIYVGMIKERKKILFVQTLQIMLLVISNFVLGGIVGGIINIICVIRNILSYYDKLDLKWKIILSVLSVGLSITFNNLGMIGLLPMFSTVLYIWLMNIKDVIKFKWLIVFTNFTWLIYDIMIISIVTAVCDLLSVITGVISINSIKKDNKKKKDKEKKQ